MTLKYKVGDCVRLVTTEHGYICGEDDDRFFQVGCIGTVTDTSWEGGAVIAMYGYGEPVYFSYDEFELVEKASDKPVEWKGEGLPPVGIDVEFPGFQDGVLVSKVARVVGIDESVVILKYKGNYHWVHINKISPIKTKEQLEEEAKAQEREKAINKMEWDGGSDLSLAERLLLERLYDAGYRKMESTND